MTGIVATSVCGGVTAPAILGFQRKPCYKPSSGYNAASEDESHWHCLDIHQSTRDPLANIEEYCEIDKALNTENAPVKLPFCERTRITHELIPDDKRIGGSVAGGKQKVHNAARCCGMQSLSVMLRE